MQVVLMRHGEAVDSRLAADDSRRWLTDGGRRTVRSVGRTFAGLDLRFSCIYTSPLVRAVQTAEILAATQPAFDGPIEVHVPLSSEAGTTAQALSPLDHAPDDSVIVMVSHMPKVGGLAGHLVGTDHFPGFKTGAACLIEVAEGRGALRWMLDPASLTTS